MSGFLFDDELAAAEQIASVVDKLVVQNRFVSAFLFLPFAFGLWWLGVEHFNEERPFIRAVCIGIGLVVYVVILSFVGRLI